MKKITATFIGGSFFLVLLLSACSDQQSDFSFNNTDQGFGLTENGKQVFFYQKMPKSLTGEYICSNYIHPLYDLKGDVLTEEFPPDHPYHRGVFWTWHQLYIDTASLGDGWVNSGISQDVVKVLTENKGKNAGINLEVLWKSDKLPDGKPFMHEKTSIVVYPAGSETRKIDFTIELKALVDKLEIGGSNDPKGYGGFCVRFDIPDDMIFTTGNGPVTPQELQVAASPWMDFSGTFGNNQAKSGLAILCHPDNPVFPSPWILRQKASMQNAVFPGRERVPVSMSTPLILKYRLIIHNGGASISKLNELQAEYAALQVR